MGRSWYCFFSTYSSTLGGETRNSNSRRKVPYLKKSLTSIHYPLHHFQHVLLSQIGRRLFRLCKGIIKRKKGCANDARCEMHLNCQFLVPCWLKNSQLCAEGKIHTTQKKKRIHRTPPCTLSHLLAPTVFFSFSLPALKFSWPGTEELTVPFPRACCSRSTEETPGHHSNNPMFQLTESLMILPSFFGGGMSLYDSVRGIPLAFKKVQSVLKRP